MSSIWDYGKRQAGANLLSISKEELILTLLPRIEGKFTRQGLKVNGIRYKNENYTEKYLAGGTVTVAYNPEDVSCVWLLEKGSYIRFELIESRYRNKALSEVEKIREDKKKIMKSVSEENTQSKINLIHSIQTIVLSSVGNEKKTIKGIRENRKKEQMRTHQDYVKAGAFHE